MNIRSKHFLYRSWTIEGGVDDSSVVEKKTDGIPCSGHLATANFLT